MKITYECKKLSLVYKLMMYFFGNAFIFLIVTLISKNILISGCISVGLFLLFSLIAISESKLKVIVDDEMVYFVTKKETKEFKIDMCEFYSRIKNNDDFTLTVVCSGEKKSFDCSFLGYSKYNDLLEKLGVVGEKQVAVKLDTKK